MTLVLIDGMEDVSSWTDESSTATVVAGRTGNALQVVGTGFRVFPVPVAQRSTTMVVGFACQVASLTSVATILHYRMLTGTTVAISLRVNTNGALELRVGTTSVLATSAAGVIAPGAWNYVEVSVFHNNTAGTFQVNVNGTPVIGPLTGRDTNGGLADTDLYFGVGLSGGAASATTRFDDVYVKTGAGETFLGDITVATLYPNGNGNASQWVGSDGDSTNNYLLVDEVPPDTADHTKSSTVGQIDQYTLTDLAASGTILGVCHQATVALAAAGSQAFQLVNRRTVNSYSPTLTATSTGYAGFHYALANDPETSAAWTIANVNALQTGVIHTSVVVPPTTILDDPMESTTNWSGTDMTIVAGGTVGNAMRIQFGGAHVYTIPAGPLHVAQQTISFAYKVSALASANQLIFQLRDDGGSNLNILTLRTDSSGSTSTITVLRGGLAGTVIGTTTATITTNVWYTIEIVLLIHATTGSMVLKLNGATEINFAGNTSGGSTTNGGQYVISGPGGANFSYYDQFLATTP